MSFSDKAKENHKKPLPEQSPYVNDISMNYIILEQSKTIKLDKFVKRKKMR